MDSLLISVAHKTCAISFQNGWICGQCYAYAFYPSNHVILEKTMLTDGNGVFSDYILFSFGTLVPLLLLRLCNADLVRYL